MRKNTVLKFQIFLQLFFHNFPLCQNHVSALKRIFSRKTSHTLYSISSFQANILYPGAEKQKIHLDTPFPEPLPIWPIKINTINLLDDFTQFNGATMIAPRSHKLKIKPNPATSNRSKESWKKYGGYLPIYEKENIFQYINDYDQLCVIDADIWIRPGSPNIFKEVNSTHDLGAVFERELPLNKK